MQSRTGESAVLFVLARNVNSIDDDEDGKREQLLWMLKSVEIIMMMMMMVAAGECSGSYAAGKAGKAHLH